MADYYSPENSRINPDIDPQRIVSIDKFIILSIATFGLYEIWWIYKAWQFFKQKENSDIIPPARAIFSIFFLYQLLQKLLGFAQEKGYESEYRPIELYVCFVLTNLLSRLPPPYFLLSVLTFVFLLPPFKAFNYAIRNSPDVRVEEQDQFSMRQILILIAGIFLWSSLIMSLTGQLEPLQ